VRVAHRVARGGRRGERGREKFQGDGRQRSKKNRQRRSQKTRALDALSTMLGLDDEEYRRELGENDERGDGCFCDDKSNDSARKKKEEEEARMLDELLDDD